VAVDHLEGLPWRRPATAGTDVCRVLDSLGFVRLLEVFAVSRTSAARYPVAERLASGQDVYLRSYGVDFDLVGRGWSSRRYRRCFSIGWGLVDGRPTPGLLLAQAFADGAELRELAAEIDGVLDRRAQRHVANLAVDGVRPCLRMAAEVHWTPGA
jgi:hypothetical protein